MIVQPVVQTSAKTLPTGATFIEATDTPPRSEEALFRKLVLDHRQRLYRFVVKHIGWGTDAEDITQQAFVEAAHSYATFKGESELSTWLFQVQTWSFFIQLSSTMQKEMADAFKGIVSKI